MDKLSSKHIIFILLGLGVVSIKTYPSILVKSGGVDTWVAIIISSILLSLLLYLIISICIKKNNFSIVNIYKSVCGKYLGSLLIFFIFVTIYLTLIECSSMEANSLHSNLLLGTPTWFFAILFVFPALYSFSKGKIAIIIITLIGITLIMIAGINLFILTEQYKKYEYLLPVFSKGVTQGFLISIAKSLGLYSFIFLSLFFIEDIYDKGRLKKDFFIGMFIMIQMDIVSIIGIIATFGVQRAAMLSYPKLVQTQEISYFSFVEGGEFFVMLQIVGGWYIKYLLVFYCMNKLLRDCNISHKIYPILITLLVLFSTMYISKNIFVLLYFVNYFTYFCLFNFLIIPFLIFILYSFKNNDNANQSCS